MVEAMGTVEAGVLTALIAVGCLFLAIGTVGLLRFPNVYNRMHATSKPTTLGTAAIFLAAFVRFGPGGDGLPSLLGIAFLFLTVPTGAHMIARSAERMGVPFEEGVTWPAPPEAEPDGADAATDDGRGSLEDDESVDRAHGDEPTDEHGDESSGDESADDGGGHGSADDGGGPPSGG